MVSVFYKERSVVKSSQCFVLGNRVGLDLGVVRMKEYFRGLIIGYCSPSSTRE